MNYTLILNFGKSNEVISSAYAISAYQKENPSTKISVLTYKENEELFGIIENIDTIYTIDKDLIKSIIDNPLYSDAFALNSFTDTMDQVKKIEWSTTINYSNDNVSSYLLQAIETQKKVGTYINNNGSVTTTSNWATYQNYVASKQSRSSIPRPIIRHYLMDAKLDRQEQKVKINPDYALVAGQNFSRIRQTKGSASTQIIGISLEAGYDGHSIDIKTLERIIETLEDSKNFKPVLLLSNKRYQKEIANKLNQTFNDTLISINVDTVATSSVVSNLDLLISTANDQLAIADTLETKSIEIRDASQQLAPIVISPSSYILYQNKDSSIEDEITLVINEEFEDYLPVNKLDSTTKVYKCIEDKCGSFYTQIRGEIDVQSELRYHIERASHFQMLDQATNPELINHIKKQTDKKDLDIFVTQTKDELTSSVKILLATLRSLKAVKGSQKNLNQFISYLDTLIRMGEDDTIVGTILRFFEGKIENIQGTDLNENIQSIENELFELKAHLQSLTNTLSSLINVDIDKDLIVQRQTQNSL